MTDSSTHSAPDGIDGDWLTLGHELSEMAADMRRQADSIQRRADQAYQNAGIKADPKPNTDRILWNERPKSGLIGGGDIDEIVLHDVTVHVEQMDDRCWWIGVYRGDDRFAGNFHCDSRGRMGFSIAEDDLPWDRDECHADRAGSTGTDRAKDTQPAKGGVHGR